MTMKIKFDPSIVFAFLVHNPQPVRRRPARPPAMGDWNHALRAAAHCFVPAPDGLNTA
jgi:hypothetical protein